MEYIKLGEKQMRYNSIIWVFYDKMEKKYVQIYIPNLDRE